MAETSLKQIQEKLGRRLVSMQINGRIVDLSRQVAQHAPKPDGSRTVVFFNATTRLVGVSQNAAFSMLAAWSLRLQGVRVVHFVCDEGMGRCVLGTNRDNVETLPPCKECRAQSHQLYANSEVCWFDYQADPQIEQMIQGLSLGELQQFQYQGVDLGGVVLPSVRWILRRYHLFDDEPTRFLYRQYILSAWNVGRQFAFLLDKAKPQAVVVFNGQFFPEAMAKQVATSRHIRVITHEVGTLPFTGFFTEGEATAYPINIPSNFELSEAQNARLDEYLAQRFKGNFTMAGIQFWPEMHGLDQDFLQKAGQFNQIVSVFTNVIFDTSQAHANVAFEHMFAWLDQVLALIRSNPDTYFVIRAHPDEGRAGKESRESVALWVEANRVKEFPNVLFVDSNELISSYELIQRSKFVMVYNSTIGLEAVLMGAPVLCAGKARFTQLPTVFLAKTPGDFRRQAVQMLDADTIDVPAMFRKNARRFMYYQLFRTSLPFGDFLELGQDAGFVQLRNFGWADLLIDHSPTFKVIYNGIINGKEFLLDDKE
jgi:capsule polysaccharide modification protein KpsS